MSQISRDPTELVGQTIGKHHCYPDGFALFLGTMFAPIVDRGAPGQGLPIRKVTSFGYRPRSWECWKIR
jgi:fumarylacetoacetate (FAA) hydrolase family protein